MFPRFFAPLIFVAATAAIGQSAATPTLTHPKASPAALPSASLQARHIDRTPMEKFLLPALKRKLAASGAASTTPLDLRPDATSNGLVPNFGGYLAAPFYPARQESSCISDPFNCGVAVELTADFDKDGKPDIAVVQNDGTLNILTNNGSGGFNAPVASSNPNVTSTFISVAYAVDVNKDGYTDIVALDSGLNAILVYLNNKGVFSTPTAINIAGNYAATFAIGDVNGDGNVDIVTGTPVITGRGQSTLTVQTWLGNGDGTFNTPTTALSQTVPVSAQLQLPPNSGMVLSDLNKDGKLDLAIDLAETTGQLTGNVVVSVALGNGDGTFGALNANNPISIPLQGQFFLDLSTAGVEVADLNGDGNLDLAVDSNSTASPSLLTVALGDGSGNFKNTVQTQNVSYSNELVFVDVNGDGIPDMLQSTGTLSVWTGKGDGTFNLPANGSTYVVDGAGVQGIVTGDFNGDGALDIAQLGDDYKQVSLFAGNGKGSFAAAPVLTTTTEAGSAPSYISLQNVEDVQGKGYSSALFIDDTSTTQVVTAVSDGKGNLTYKVGLAASAVPAIGYIQPVQADFNNDGKQDLLIANTDGTLSVALSNGDGTFQQPVALALPAMDCEVAYAAAGDLNKDGNTDLVITYYGDAVCGGTGSVGSGYYVALGKGDGTFQTPVFTAYGTELYSATLADVNGDGVLDLVLDDTPFILSGTFAVDVLPGNGDGTFGAGNTVNSNYMISQVLAGDFNGDGKTDLVLLSEGEQTSTDAYTTAGILLLPGNGDGTFGAATQLATGNFFLNGQLADLNGDGLQDLVVALYQTVGQPKTYYGLSTLLGQGGGSFSAPVNVLESMNSSLPLIGNFYNDNAPDVLVNTGYGPALFLGKGGTTLSLGGSASSIAFGASETLTASIAASLPSQPTPTGTVSFYDGKTLLGSSPLSNGSAVFATSLLSVGAHSVTATYSGDANFNPNTSAVSTITVTTVTPAFTLSATPATASISAGQNAVATLTLAANSTFSGAVNLTCTGAPANSTCTINPSSVTLAAGGTETATLVVSSTTNKSSLAQPSLPLHGASSGGILTLAAVFGILGLWKSRRRFALTLSLLALIVVGLGFTGCGSSSSVNSVKKGSYTITITATPTGTAGTAQQTSFAITVN